MTAPWRAPPRASRDWKPGTEREQAVEAALRLGGADGGEPDDARLILRVLTGKCDGHVTEGIDVLLDLADAVADAEEGRLAVSQDDGGPGRWTRADAKQAATDNYEAALHTFTYGRFDRDVDAALAVQDARRLSLVRGAR